MDDEFARKQLPVYIPVAAVAGAQECRISGIQGDDAFVHSKLLAEVEGEDRRRTVRIRRMDDQKRPRGQRRKRAAGNNPGSFQDDALDPVDANWRP